MRLAIGYSGSNSLSPEPCALIPLVETPKTKCSLYGALRAIGLGR
jgi:hypothetical protein